MEIVFATNNPHKLEEAEAILGDSEIKFILPPSEFDPVEDGATFYENSLIKAKAASRLSGKMSLADDSGLCVEALEGAPGLHSARYAGTQAEKIEKLLKELEPHSNRRAKFACSMVLVDGAGEVLFSSLGECHGQITMSADGVNGFGYDPIFKIDGMDLTMAQIPEGLKNKLSHRALALNKIIEWITPL